MKNKVQCLQVRDNMKNIDKRIADLLLDTTLSQHTKHIVLVYGPYDRCDDIAYYHASLWRKEDGVFHKVLETLDARCGENGLSDHKVSGDKTTPIGAYRLTEAFGFGENIGTNMPYHKLNEHSWGDDTEAWGSYANRYYEGEHPADDKEHMVAHFQYEFGMNIGYNYDPVEYGKGSAIFLHCNGKGNTAGCVSVPSTTMQELMLEVKEPAYILIVPRIEDIANY